MRIKTAKLISICLVIIGDSICFATPLIYLPILHPPITFSYVLSFPTTFIGLIITAIGIIGIFLVKCINIPWKTDSNKE